MPLSEAEARPITVRVRIATLQVDDQVGPQDVTQPITYKVIGAPARTEAQRTDPVALRIRALDGTESTLNGAASTLVYVRRYVSAIRPVRAEDGTVDRVAPVVVMRPVGGLETLTVVDSTALRLRAGDQATFAAG